MQLRRMGGYLALTAVAVWLSAVSPISADSQEREFRARLDGGHETPAISTSAKGAFRASLNPAGKRTGI